MKPLGLATLAALLAATTQAAGAAPVPEELLSPLRAGRSVGVIVELDASDVDLRARPQLPERYRALKDRVLRPLQRADIEATLDYSHLPMSFKRLRTEAALRALAARPGVRAVHPDRLYQHALVQSLPLMAQPVVGSAGLRGAGSTVAVIDDGINLTHPDFGGCTAVATPASCRIAAVQTFVANPNPGSAHGSNVAAIVIGVAPDARVASLDVFGASGALTSSILNAINWAIAQRESLNIVAINMSLGDGTHQTAPCGDALGNPFATAITNARNADMSVVIAAGNNAYNNGSFSLGLSRPACTPGAISVGAVYDGALGDRTWSAGQPTQCTDLSTAANQVACFSNSASYLSLLAPGALITAGGFTFGGTSQAAPHVAGALAVLRAAFPDRTLATVEAQLGATGTALTDPRSGSSSPGLNLQAAAASLSASNADVPTLPEWGVLMLASFLVWRGIRRPSAPLSLAGGNG
ncbi:MAG: IPTL-CTERM sorting domain-containing protein [Rhizobacter sp.]|nr:IPTL-CTERM sorting domain-containing protein [Rhizobacter sp.]